MRELSTLAVAILCSSCALQPNRTVSGNSPLLQRAEALIDAFYSFDPSRLREAMSTAPDSLPVIGYYQGWAHGGNYLVLNRKPCRFETPDEIRCSITVKDDLIAALRTGYNVTDTFHISVKEGRIIDVKTSSDDPPEFKQALNWLATERPELMDGACRGFFADGPTPQQCVREVVAGFKAFASRKRS